MSPGSSTESYPAFARIGLRENLGKNLNQEVHQEVHSFAKDGSSRRVDIIAIDRRNDRAIIIDPTVRFETAVEQPIAVHEEKKTIYDPTIQYFRDYYHIQGQIEVFALLFGARGKIPKFSVEFPSVGRFFLASGLDNFLFSYDITRLRDFGSDRAVQWEIRITAY
ncbi:hypothetical protein ANN_05048 [Periplaneta americana]|uniref:Uncharacterized protein n=1 Tax=Periplaneta americana TaxID=6978 RepID=A0ABQ8TA17_PERAM|nr:hypothetical protein ANN_05048 [Periplaneta americana]